MVDLRVTFDRSANAAYIYLEPTEKTPPARQILVEERGVGGMVILDVTAKGRLIGIEVIGATGALPYELLEKAERI